MMVGGVLLNFKKTLIQIWTRTIFSLIRYSYVPRHSKNCLSRGGNLTVEGTVQHQKIKS